MLWTLRFEPANGPIADAPPEGRFVVQRHRDQAGPHLDLRLEQPGGYLLGWRIDAPSLEGETFASEKAPHPLSWLEQDGDSIREDAGAYRWLEHDGNGGRLLLDGARGRRVVNVARGQAVSALDVRAIQQTADRLSVRMGDAARLMEDGATARARAIERFCGLGRELDGASFDEALWRKTLRDLPLAELQSHLRGYEVRFDAKYPPQPVSQPAPLDEEESAAGASGRVLALLRG
jgi:hypothetical protein